MECNAKYVNADSVKRFVGIDDAIFDAEPGKGIIAIELDANREVRLAGFGTFDSKRRSARQGRNPATGQTITIAAKTYPTFKAAKGLKDRVSD